MDIRIIGMTIEEFIISGVKSDEENSVLVSFSPVNIQERLEVAIDRSVKKFQKQNGSDAIFPEHWKQQIRAQGLPPMLMRFGIPQWNHKGLALNDRVTINVPEFIDDVTPVKKIDDFGV